MTFKYQKGPVPALLRVYKTVINEFIMFLKLLMITSIFFLLNQKPKIKTAGQYKQLFHTL